MSKRTLEIVVRSSPSEAPRPMGMYTDQPEVSANQLTLKKRLPIRA